MKSVLSCIQPTGDMHLGNYFGAVKNWVDLQKDYKCYYGVVDYHAMTMPYDIKKLRNNTWELIFNLLAVMAVPGLIQTTQIDPAAFSRDYTSMAGLTLLLALGMAAAFLFRADKSKAGIGWPFGLAMLGLYAGYYVILYQTTAQ